MARRLGIKGSGTSGPLVGLASLLAVGFIVGFFGGWLWVSVGQEGIGENDYVVMVSLLYERDRSVPNAMERLAALEKSDTVRSIAGLAEAYPKIRPEAQTEARALRQLATALSKSSGEANSQTNVAPEGEGGSGGIWLVLGIALVFVVFLGVAGPFALRFASSTRRGFVLPWSKGTRRNSLSFGGKSGRRPTISAGNVRTARRAPQPLVEESSLVDENPPTESWPAKAPAGLRFQSGYAFGEDPYDEVHPITDRETGSLIGACGLSAELKLSEDIPGHYYAFSFWAHDYVGDGNLRRIALVSKWAKAKAPAELVRWTERSRVDEVVVANPGIRLLIDTANLAIDVNIASFRYGSDAEAPPDAYFSSLDATFDVQMKNSVEIT